MKTSGGVVTSLILVLKRRLARALVSMLACAFFWVPSGGLAQTAQSAGCKECEALKQTQNSNLQKLLDTSAEMYGKTDSCLKSLGPDSIRIYNCMQKFYSHFLDGSVSDAEADKEASGCAGLVPDKSARAAGLGMAVSIAAQKLFQDGQKILEKAKKKLPLTADEMKVLEAIEKPYQEEQQRQQKLEKIAKQAPGILQSNGARYDSKNKTWDFSHFNFNKLGKGSSELAALMITYPQAASDLKKLYIDGTGYARSVQLGNRVIIPNLDTGSQTRFTPQVMTREQFDQETKATLGIIGDSAKTYLKASAQYNTYGNTLGRFFRQFTAKARTSTATEHTMYQSAQNITRAHRDLVFKYGLDKERTEFITNQVRATLDQGGHDLDGAIGKIDNLTKAAWGTAIAIGSVYTAGTLAPALAVAAGSAGWIAPETVAAIGSVGGTLSTSITSGLAVTGTVQAVGATFKAATKVISQGGDQFFCRLGSEMLEENIAGQVGALQSVPMTAAVSLVAPFLGPSLAALKIFKPSVVSGVSRYGVALLFGAPQAIQTRGDFKKSQEYYKQADALEKSGQYDAAQAARMQGHMARIDAIWNPLGNVLFMGVPAVEKFHVLPEDLPAEKNLLARGEDPVIKRPSVESQSQSDLRSQSDSGGQSDLGTQANLENRQQPQELSQSEKSSNPSSDGKSVTISKTSIATESSEPETSHRYFKLSPEQVQEERAANRALYDGYKAEIKNEGKRELQDIRAGMKEGKPKSYDAIVLGAGPQAAAVAAQIKAERPDAKVLILEATEGFGTFDRFGNSFRGNTKETLEWSANPFVGSSIQPGHVNFSGDTFVSARDFGDATISSLAESKVPVLTSTRASYGLAPKGSGHVMRFVTADGLMIDTDQGVAITGFGDSSLGVTDPASIKLHAKYKEQAQVERQNGNLQYAPPIETIDDFLPRMSEQVQVIRDTNGPVPQPWAPYKGKRVMVSGGKHGALSVVDALGNHTPGLQDPKIEPPDFAQIQLQGQKAKTSKELLSGLAEKVRDRYHGAAGELDKAHVISDDRRILSWQEVKDSHGQPYLKVKVANADGSISFVDTDYLITATGYKSASDRQIATLKDEGLKQHTVTSSLVDFCDYSCMIQNKEVVGDFVGNESGGMWYAGSASPSVRGGVDAKLPDEIHGGFIDAQTPRSAALGKEIARAIKRPVSPGFEPRNLQEGVGSTTFRGAFPAAAQVQQIKAPVTLMNMARVELGRSLTEGNFRFPAGSKIKIEINSKGDATAVGLDRKSATALFSFLKQNQNLAQALSEIRSSSRKTVEIDFPVRSDGTPRKEQMVFQVQK